MKLMNPLNPFYVMYEEYSEAQTNTEKIVAIILGLWVAVLMSLFFLGMAAIIHTIITNPSALDNATWGIFDTLG